MTKRTTPPVCGWGKRQKAILAVAVVSLLFNLMAVLPYSSLFYSKLERKFFPPAHFTIQTPDEEVLDKVCEATLCMKGVKMSMGEYKGLPEDLRAFFREKRNAKARNNYYTSYAMVGLSYYAMSQKDSVVMDRLREKADAFVDSDSKGLTYPIIRIDQAPIGILFLNLYHWYNDKLYLDVAHTIFKKVDSMRETDGTIMYSPGYDCNLSDAVGMYVPFLMEYYNTTKDPKALAIVDYNMSLYYAKGVDHETGIPFHGYNIKNGVHVGSANWGRGIGWYLLASAYCPQTEDTVLTKTLSTLEYTQYPGCGGHFDSSTALMFEIYKQSKDSNRVLSLDFIKPHVLSDGFVDDCSGDTYGLNSYSHSFSVSELCNGLLLMLVSRFDNSQSDDEINS